MDEIYNKIEAAEGKTSVTFTMEEINTILSHLVNNKEIIEIYSKWIDDLTAKLQIALKRLNQVN